MDSKHIKTLKSFLLRVERVEESRYAPFPADEIDNSEIITALYILIKDKLEEKKRFKKIAKKLEKNLNRINS